MKHVLFVIGLLAVLGSGDLQSDIEKEWAKPLDAGFAQAPQPKKAPPPAPAPPAKRANEETCDSKDDCLSGHCCYTVIASICAASCTYNDVRFPGAEERCRSVADCKKGQECVTRATSDSKIMKVCQ